MRTKDKLLLFLEEARGTYISGAELADRLSISRGAVWKAVKSLQADGYEIDAVTRRGYCLSGSSDVLTPNAVRRFFSPQAAHLEVAVCPDVPSTSQVVRERMIKDSSGEFVILAETQTEGRGRRGRRFFSPPKTGLYMSILLKPELQGTQATLLTAAAAVAVAETLEQFSGQRTRIKWVNDIFQQGKKVAGILTEAGMSVETGRVDYVILGIGINLYAPEKGFPEELPQAGAVFEKPAEISNLRSRIAAEIINRLLPMCETLAYRPFLEAYRRRSLVPGQTVTVLQEPENRLATVLEIDDNCRLRVRYETGEEETLSSGEISIQPESGCIN